MRPEWLLTTEWPEHGHHDNHEVHALLHKVSFHYVCATLQNEFNISIDQRDNTVHFFCQTALSYMYWEAAGT